MWGSKQFLFYLSYPEYSTDNSGFHNAKGWIRFLERRKKKSAFLILYLRKKIELASFYVATASALVFPIAAPNNLISGVLFEGKIVGA